MRALVQRVSEAEVRVGDEVTGAIGAGLLILVCAMAGDGPEDADRLADRIARLRIFRDGDGKMNLSLQDTGGAALVVSQFTLAADTRRGNRPSYSAAAKPDEAEPLVARFAHALTRSGIPVQTGRFAADMDVRLVNRGPVTIWLDSR
jgi:D-aminoacyl-tRNA deacylase